MQSESIENLAKSLIKLQGSLKPAFRNASNPFFKSKYADLESVINSAKSLLLENRLAISQPAISEGEKIGVQTILMHESGEWIASKILFAVSGKNIAQAGGSIISYARRYAYASILGIVTGEDNDAQHPEPPKQQAPQPQPTDPNKAIKKEIFSLLIRLGMSKDDAKIYATREAEKLQGDYNSLLSHITDLQVSHKWHPASHQFISNQKGQ